MLVTTPVTRADEVSSVEAADVDVRCHGAAQGITAFSQPFEREGGCQRAPKLQRHHPSRFFALLLRNLEIDYFSK